MTTTTVTESSVSSRVGIGIPLFLLNQSPGHSRAGRGGRRTERALGTALGQFAGLSNAKNRSPRELRFRINLLCQVFGRYLGVTSLQMCALLGTKITDAGFADLQKALANCEIVK